MSSISPEFARVSALMALAVPIAAGETVLAYRASWWNLPLEAMAQWALAAALILGALTGWLLMGRRFPLYLFRVIAVCWVALSFFYAYRIESFWLGMLALGLASYWTLVLMMLENVLGRSFLAPDLKWFEGLPKAIPGLMCEVEAQSGIPQKCRVSGLDSRGVLLIPESNQAISVKAGDSKLKFLFQDRQLECDVRVVSEIRKGMAVGLGFVKLSPDTEKDLLDLIEALRGAGYVA